MLLFFQRAKINCFKNVLFWSWRISIFLRWDQITLVEMRLLDQLATNYRLLNMIRMIGQNEVLRDFKGNGTRDYQYIGVRVGLRTFPKTTCFLGPWGTCLSLFLLQKSATIHTSMASHVPKKNLTRKNGLGEGQKYYSA